MARGNVNSRRKTPQPIAVGLSDVNRRCYRVPKHSSLQVEAIKCNQTSVKYGVNVHTVPARHERTVK